MSALGQPWDLLLAISTVVVALGVLWTKFLRPTMRAFGQVDEYGPVLADIAREFRGDPGPTLRETLTMIQNTAAALDVRLSRIEHQLEAQDKRLDRIQTDIRSAFMRERDVAAQRVTDRTEYAERDARQDGIGGAAAQRLARQGAQRRKKEGDVEAAE